ncbi:adenosylmethionine decarboxylase [Arenibacterium sp. CAU 1754]
MGVHQIVEFYGARELFDASGIAPVLTRAAKAANAQVLKIEAHDFGDRAGFTAVALLAESHISLHTWPEYDYAAIDIFMCGDAKPERAVAVLEEFFAPETVLQQTIQRGLPERMQTRSKMTGT